MSGFSVLSQAFQAFSSGTALIDPPLGGTGTINLSSMAFGYILLPTGTYTIPVAPGGVFLTIRASGSVTLRDAAGDIITALASGDLAVVVSDGTTWTPIGGSGSAGGEAVNIMSAGAIPDDDTVDNWPMIVAALQLAVTNGKRAIYVPPGDFYTGPWEVNDYPELFENCLIIGAGREDCGQQQEEDGQGDKQFSRFICNGVGATDWLWDQQSTNRFGPVRIERLTFQFPTRANGFRFGDYTDATASLADSRGVKLKHCYFTSLQHYASSALSSSWLANTGAAGYVLNRSRTIGVQIWRGYDVSVEECSFRGFWTQVDLVHCDAPAVRNTHHMFAPRFIISRDAAPTGINGAVKGFFENIYGEGPTVAGFTFNGGRIVGPRVEAGYSSSVEPDIGGYALPAAITWTVTHDTSVISLGPAAGTPSAWQIVGGVTYDATDYFEPYTYITLTDSASYVHKLFVLSVTANSVTFDGNYAYFPATISGVGTAISRKFGVPCLLRGDYNNVFGPEFEYNENATLPRGVIVPGKKTTQIFGGSTQPDTNEPTTPRENLWEICANNHADEGFMAGRAEFFGAPNAADHPLADVFGGPGYDGQLLGAQQLPTWPFSKNERLLQTQTRDFDFVATPGRGFTSASSNARNHKFRTQDDVHVIKVIATSPGWTVPLVTYGDFDVTLRVYGSGSGTLTVWNGSTNKNVTMTSGWQTITPVEDADLSLTSATDLILGCDVAAYVAWVGIKYT